MTTLPPMSDAVKTPPWAKTTEVSERSPKGSGWLYEHLADEIRIPGTELTIQITQAVEVDRELVIVHQPAVALFSSTDKEELTVDQARKLGRVCTLAAAALEAIEAGMQTASES